MSRYFKTSTVHSCFSQELNERKPRKCKCRRYVSHEKAIEMVNTGEANWLIDYSLNIPIPTWHIVLYGRVNKTPRSHTLERAHIERYLERQAYYQDLEWIFNEHIDAEKRAKAESVSLWDEYHSIEIEERLKLFYKSGPELLKLKKLSDSQGVLTGGTGKVLSDKLVDEANKIKQSNIIDDPFVGEAIFMPIGAGDSRTEGGVGVTKIKKLDKN